VIQKRSWAHKRVSEELEKLLSMKETGNLTEAQFHSQKALLIK
jgi:hypothetical protein